MHKDARRTLSKNYDGWSSFTKIASCYFPVIFGFRTRFRTIARRCSVKKEVWNFAKLTGKHLCQSLFFNKVAGLKLWHKCFPANFEKFLRTPFPYRTPPLATSEQCVPSEILAFRDSQSKNIALFLSSSWSGNNMLRRHDIFPFMGQNIFHKCLHVFQKFSMN